MPQFQVRQLTARGVGHERGQAHAVAVGNRTSPGSGRSFRATTRIPRPGRQIQQVSDFGDPGTVADLSVGVVGRSPRLLGNRIRSLRRGKSVKENPTEYDRRRFLGGILDQRVGAARTVDTHQHFLPDPVRRIGRQLRECVLHDRDVVGGGIRAGAAAQQHRDGFTGAAVAVVDERVQWMETEAPLGMSEQQIPSRRAVTRVASMSRTSGCASSMSWSGADVPAAAQAWARAAARARLIAASAVPASPASAPDQAGDSAGWRPPHRRFPVGAQLCDVGEAVPADRQAHGEVEDDLAGVVSGQLFPIRCELGRQRRCGEAFVLRSAQQQDRSPRATRCRFQADADTDG